ncbi:uncharacterized protein EI90DRAFT_3040762 [Cantharellus anzutake]|uniref:uncharacterized protein n=1 Tax=Cantharellus anzutake TaxID=1750568 RepID=UPI001902C947|nr:uncharacterized protein EI90DRAFT_3040762 [Cantharellus anzutake]KAF8339193.1 hypothetical protein EI90DRAFT_3040762 [Cantharellus anzutake]
MILAWSQAVALLWARVKFSCFRATVILRWLTSWYGTFWRFPRAYLPTVSGPRLASLKATYCTQPIHHLDVRRRRWS